MIKLKTREDIELMYESSQIVSKTLGMLAKEIKPGVTSLHLDKLAEEFIRDHDAVPGFLGMYDFPNTLNMSPNEQVVHGIPNNKPLQEGDIISVDCGAIKNGFFSDHAYTFSVGEIDPAVAKMMEITKESLYAGIRKCKVGNRIGDISFAIQLICENAGYGVVRELVGHGLGRDLHEDPQVPNYGRKGKGPRIEEGLTVAIEPMINLGTYKVKFHNDGWTVTTYDNKPSCHFEHDVAVVDGQPRLLSTYGYIYEALGITSHEEDEFLYHSIRS
ncbi:MAG: type I methionyl aminopeptidase [Flavobacteriaceae bacterium]|jgi:methionyl aminopeptidase|nr:type I methionyl aminopeptidase [Flavobacteriaceae bacterium]